MEFDFLGRCPQGHAENGGAFVFPANPAAGVPDRVMAHCNPENIASWKVLEKIGMRREGNFRRNIFFKTAADGTPLWVDTFEYAILKDDIK